VRSGEGKEGGEARTGSEKQGSVAREKSFFTLLPRPVAGNRRLYIRGMAWYRDSNENSGLSPRRETVVYSQGRHGCRLYGFLGFCSAKTQSAKMAWMPFCAAQGIEAEIPQTAPPQAGRSRNWSG
jgi:hypothetical protein